MKENREVMKERAINVPVVLGGASLTRRYVEDDLKSLYKGTLFYARDAFAGLHTMDKLMSGNGESAERQLERASLERPHPAGGAQVSSLLADEPEELLAEEAKLGVRKPTRVRAVSGDTTH